MNQVKQTIVGILIMVSVISLWTFYYVIPTDQYRDQVSQCVEDKGFTDISREAWKACDAELIGNAPHSVKLLRF